MKTNHTFLRNVLPTSVDIGLDHDTGDDVVTSNRLLPDVTDNLWLIFVVLREVSV